MSCLWAITTYFNPMGWRNRRDNYKLFREHLGVKLLTVEWSPHGHFSLDSGDADLLVQIEGGELMWQKERMLNIALGRLPAECEFVAWLDCDILFGDPRWPASALALLQENHVIQLYGTVKYLGPDASILGGIADLSQQAGSTRPSLLHSFLNAPNPSLWLEEELRRRGEIFRDPATPYVPQATNVSPGFAWAARREWIETCGGLPDRAVIGGGDMEAAYGFLGILGPYTETLLRCGLTDYCSSHTQNWAKTIGSSQPSVGSLATEIYHLYHGQIADRHYIRRKHDLVSAGFHPDRHLEPDAGGAWRFTQDAPAAIRDLMGRYFAERLEDGLRPSGSGAAAGGAG